MTFTLINPTKNCFKFMDWTGTGLKELMEEVTISQNSIDNCEYIANYLANPYLYTEDTGQTGKNLSEVTNNMNQSAKEAVITLKIDSNIEDFSGIDFFTNLEKLDLTETYSIEKVNLSRQYHNQEH